MAVIYGGGDIGDGRERGWKGGGGLKGRWRERRKGKGKWEEVFMMWTGGLWWLAERFSGQSADCSSSIAVVR